MAKRTMCEREKSNFTPEIGALRPANVLRHESICGELSALYERKNHDYGDSFHRSFEEWGLPMAAIRLGDKYNRFCWLIKAEAQVKDESLRDTLMDMANYAIMAVMEMDREKEGTGDENVLLPFEVPCCAAQQKES